MSKTKVSSLDRIFPNFICDGRQPRISKAFLQRPKTSGGMSIPKLLCYNWASNIQKVITHVQSNALEHAPEW